MWQECEEYGVKKQTVSDIRGSKDKLRGYAVKFSVDSMGKVGDRIRMTPSKDIGLEKAMFKWYKQEGAAEVQVTRITLCSAEEALAEQMGTMNFRVSDEWLWRFHHRYGFMNFLVHGEGGSSDTASVKPFRK